MDIEKLIDEVVRRLLLKIEQEQGKCCVDATSGATAKAGCCSGGKSGKLVITQDKAAAVASGSKVVYPKGTLVTPLAKDVFKERGVCVEFE